MIGLLILKNIFGIQPKKSLKKINRVVCMIGIY